MSDFNSYPFGAPCESRISELIHGKGRRIYAGPPKGHDSHAHSAHVQELICRGSVRRELQSRKMGSPDGYEFSVRR